MMDEIVRGAYTLRGQQTELTLDNNMIVPAFRVQEVVIRPTPPPMIRLDVEVDVQLNVQFHEDPHGVVVTSLECPLCGGSAVESKSGYFHEFMGDKCQSCGMPGSVYIDNSGDQNVAYWRSKEEAD